MKYVYLVLGANGIAAFAVSVLLITFFSGFALAQDQTVDEPVILNGARTPVAPLSLAEAVRIAVTSEEPSLLVFDARAEAFEEIAVADAQLPDPTARAALANIPAATLNLNDEANWTQFQFGLRQDIPRGDTLELSGRRSRVQAERERARKALTLREIALAVRTGWLDRFYLVHAQTIVTESRAAVSELVDALGASFATGSLTSQDILAVELELALFDDRLAEYRQREAQAEANLSRYIGMAATRPPPEQLPNLHNPSNLHEMEARLARHPAILAEDASVAIEGIEVRLAEEAYKPSWAVDASYGLRRGGFSDFATIGVSVSIPLFPNFRQDRSLVAAQKERGAANFNRSAALLDLPFVL